MSESFGLFKGLKVTFKELFRKSVTDKYPKEFREKPQRFHGRHVLNRYEDGMEKCIGCELCAGVCPAQCIYVRGEDNPEDEPVSPGERYGFIYEINMLRCIYCALCVEACPTEAITMTSLFEMSVANRSEAIFDKSVLVVNDDGTPNTHEEQTKLTRYKHSTTVPLSLDFTQVVPIRSQYLLSKLKTLSACDVCALSTCVRRACA